MSLSMNDLLLGAEEYRNKRLTPQNIGCPKPTVSFKIVSTGRKWLHGEIYVQFPTYVRTGKSHVYKDREETMPGWVPDRNLRKKMSNPQYRGTRRSDEAPFVYVGHGYIKIRVKLLLEELDPLTRISVGGIKPAKKELKEAALKQLKAELEPKVEEVKRVS